MAIKAKAPKEDPETKARREQAEQQAEERQVREIRDDVSRETDALLRRFGVRAAQSGFPSLARTVTGGSTATASGSGASSSRSIAQQALSQAFGRAR